MLKFLYWLVIITGNLIILFGAISPFVGETEGDEKDNLEGDEKDDLGGEEKDSLGCYYLVGLIHVIFAFSLLLIASFFTTITHFIALILRRIGQILDSISYTALDIANSLIGTEVSIDSWEIWIPVIIFALSFIYVFITIILPWLKWKEGGPGIFDNPNYFEKRIYSFVGFILWFSLLSCIFSGCSNVVFYGKIFYVNCAPL